ncbi:hypothetical protein ASPZODRAFT_73743 [Penicilliopsis zonata CBS 506.65]|uniref:Uncharacterized protein n=1 Tax=Penicilliopsis zonata CBS 506.65 TaxID=1073090 RepID=A0A1L9S9D9_9EURO|nr:hypothetical protein ASPZODRAFT_73743 [Penicilliopsis zonata CBS 506.65]OJJ43776.1 hypothetical protein ASPZODRAFT_73743 [Penicilliopsis zonata CBS 506.65]
MSTAVAPATAAPLASPHMNRDHSPKNCPTLVPSSTSTPTRMSTASQDGSATRRSPTDRKRSPITQSGNGPSKVVVKKEPPSPPGMQSRPRPRKLDLSITSDRLSARAPGGPMTAREGVRMQDVGLACLSPGFQTHDPVMREQLQRSLSVRDQQRSIIEARLHKTPKDDGSGEVGKPSDSSLFTPARSGSKRRPPPGLSIVPPSASHFANERVIQSAPLNQTFTGRHDPPPMTRHLVNNTPHLGSSSHIHHLPATQTNNRLPPLSDVFGSDALGARDRDSRPGYYQGGTASGSSSSQSNNLPPVPSPGLPPSTILSRPREYRSAEEAVHELSGGREDLLPRIVHYGGHQPPTPPSPHLLGGGTVHKTSTASGGGSYPSADATTSAAAASLGGPPSSYLHPADGTARRRPRSEYEQDNGSPPLGYGPETQHRSNPALASSSGASSAGYGPFGAGRDSPETQRRKKEEFLSLCARAWDLFHS